MQDCSVYLRKGLVYVVSQSYTVQGLGLSVGPMFKVEEITSREVGKAVVAALDASRRGIPDPPDFTQLQKELLRFLEVKSFGELTKSSTLVDIRRDSSRITVTNHRVAIGGGFEPEGSGISHSTSDVDEVGRIVMNALNLN